MEDLKLVEYDNPYAKAIAEMWRRSSEGWNGNWGTETEESILRAHEDSTDLNTYLALKGEEVVGYCGFSKYEYDENTLYIRLLNVRYDLHGMSIGRTLVCKSVDRTIELGYPRLDLYTWSGNTKSVPLYKRCGFFLEKRDDSTHLMNFIPGVVNSEVFKEYFNRVHWYRDLKRTIDMEPDGIEENGFVYYEYLWEKENESLKVQFENKSRGIRFIETEDYLIKAEIEDQQLIFGDNYKIKYEVVNKSKKPLTIEIEGVGDKNINYSMNTKLEVLDKDTIEGEFLVNEPKEKVGLFGTYPSVVSKVLINGKSVEFKIGIDAKYPADMALRCPRVEGHRDTKAIMYLDIKNNYKKEAAFNFTLIENSHVEFIDKEFSIKMKGNERKSIEISYILKDFSFYNEDIEVKALDENGREVVFNKTLTAPLQGRQGRFGGNLEESYVVVNGLYSAKLDEENNISLDKIGINKVRNSIFYPMLGKPFSEEFSNGSPSKIENYEEDEKIVLKATFISKDFENLRVESILKLSQNGIGEHYYEVYNDGDYETVNEVTLSEGLFIKLNEGILPLKNEFVEIIDPRGGWMDTFNFEDLTENWMYSRESDGTIGICWHKDVKAKLRSWYMSLDYELGKLKGKEKKITKSVFIALDTFKHWKNFRNFALEKVSYDSLELTKDLGMVLNGGNPFVKDNFTVKVKQYEHYGLEGEYFITSKANSFEKVGRIIDEKTSEIEFNISLDRDVHRDVLTLEMDSKSMCLEEEKMVFKVNDVPFESKIVEEEGHKVFSVNNGVMEIKACPTFSHVLYSLTYNNHQWLESSFPTPRPKSWFNPWFGGIGTVPEELSNRSVLDGNIQGNFVTMEDNFKNKWQGIKVELLIEKQEKFKGLQINQYYLMLPGLPILCYTSEIVQNTGKFLDYETFETFSFFNLDEEVKNNWIKVKNSKGSFNKYKVGGEGLDILTKSSLLYGTNSLKDKIQLYSKFEEEKCFGFVNLNDTACSNLRNITLEHGAVKFTPPEFYIFTEEYIEDEMIRDLRNIKFK